jgi:hypothetical protein
LHNFYQKVDRKGYAMTDKQEYTQEELERARRVIQALGLPITPEKGLEIIKAMEKAFNTNTSHAEGKDSYQDDIEPEYYSDGSTDEYDDNWHDQQVDTPLKEYQVKWRIGGSVGMPPYNGTKTVWAEDDDAAARRAQREVHRNGFQDVSIGRIEIVSVTRNG